ncbi:MAG: hypothetical protein ABS948_04165 [Solibacillus sp.]
MNGFDIFREEILFEVDEIDFLTFRKHLTILMDSPHALHSSHPESLDKLYLFQDFWFLIQYGKQYKGFIREQEVAIKKIRLSFLEFVATLDELEAAKTLSNQERFIFCYRYLIGLFDHSRKRAREGAALQGMRKDYYDALSQKEMNQELQQKVIERYYSEWFKQGYLLGKLFHEKFVEVKQISQALQDVCGLRIQHQEQNLYYFIQAVLKADDFLEIAFWKKQFTQQGLPTLFNHQEEMELPTIVVCTQQSEAMRPLLNRQLGLICAISVMSEEEARDFVYIPYAEQISKELYCEKGQITIARYLEIVHEFIGGEGPPNYRQLLNLTFTMFKLSTTSSSGKIVLICDDQIQKYVPQDGDWQQAVERYKNEMGIRILVLYSGVCDPQMSLWFADEIICIEEFQMKKEVM